MPVLEIENGVSGAGAPIELWRDALLRRIMVSAFLVFFQGYMVAPLIPHLASEFGVSRQAIGAMVPAYLLPYALGTLVYGLLVERYGRRIVLFVCFGFFSFFCAISATAHTVESLILWRVATGVAGGGVAVSAMTLIGDLFPIERRGRALGGFFAAIAGGLAFGSTLGGILTPLIGWRNLFLFVGVSCGLALLSMVPLWRHLAPPPRTEVEPLGEMLRGYAGILRLTRSRKTYVFILLNGIFHSGVFTWLGVYLFDRYHLGEAGIGLALLGYGIPGFFFGPLIGHMVDKKGRARLLPWGLGIAALAAAALMLKMPLLAATAVITILSFGFDMSHPLLAGIVTTLAPERRGQAMALNTFTLFLGSGLGSLFFGWAMQQWGFSGAAGAFALGQMALAVTAIPLFQAEQPQVAPKFTELTRCGEIPCP